MFIATVSGHIGKNAVTRSVGDTTVTSFSVASTRKVKGEAKTEWVECSLWGKRGEALVSYLTKGQSVTVVGEVSTRRYEGANGVGFSVEIRVSEVALQGGAREERRDADSEEVGQALAGMGAVSASSYGGEPRKPNLPAPPAGWTQQGYGAADEEIPF